MPLGGTRRRRYIVAKTLAAAAAVGVLWTASAFAVRQRHATAARRLYDRGMGAHYAGDSVGANQLFRAAIAEDSTLAIAAMTAALYASDSATYTRLMATALRYAPAAPVRERLRIRLEWARRSNDPTAASIVDSLVRLDPRNPEGYLELARARAVTGDYLAVLPLARRAIALDSAGFAGPVEGCRGCDAFALLTSAYLAIDSLDASERTTREWIARDPRRFEPWPWLAIGAARRGRAQEAIDALDRATTLKPAAASADFRAVQIRMFLEDYAAADRLIADTIRTGREATWADALWWSALSLRNQGRLREGLDVADRFAVLARQYIDSGIAPVPRAVVLLEIGRPGESRALFEAITNATLVREGVLPSVQARRLTWGLARTATATAAMGDTAALKVIADSVERIGRLSTMERDRRLHHYVRANVLVARGALAEAADEYRAAIESPTMGYTRINLELGRVLLALGRPQEAAVISRAGLHGALESNNYYVTRTELHELVAKAFDAAGMPDSAAAHYGKVAAAWEHGDSAFRERARAARDRLASLTARTVRH